MSTQYLKPASTGMRKPTDPEKMNGLHVNPPRYAEHGGFTGPSKAVDGGNVFRISKPGGGRG
jgi:hypothetical protein